MRDFDPAAAAGTAERFLRTQLEESGLDGYVLGVSGGLDSAVALTAAVEAVGSGGVTAMIMPGRPSREEHMEDARALVDDLGVPSRSIAIEPIVEQFRRGYPDDLDPATVGNVRARSRMVLEYVEANAHDLLVLGAGNRSELLLGYFTKYGDAAVDVRPFADVYKTEMAELADALDVDARFVEKTPTAGLWEGQTDEGELGASYDEIDPFLHSLVDRGDDLDVAARRAGLSTDEAASFQRMVRTSAHKRSPPPHPASGR